MQLTFSNASLLKHFMVLLYRWAGDGTWSVPSAYWCEASGLRHYQSLPLLQLWMSNEDTLAIVTFSSAYQHLIFAVFNKMIMLRSLRSNFKMGMLCQSATFGNCYHTWLKWLRRGRVWLCPQSQDHQSTITGLYSGANNDTEHHRRASWGSQKAEKRQVIWMLAASEARACSVASSLDVHLPVTPQGHYSVCGLGKQ